MLVRCQGLLWLTNKRILFEEKLAPKCADRILKDYLKISKEPFFLETMQPLQIKGGKADHHS